MMETIQITIEEVENTAEKIRMISEVLNETLEDIKQEINSLDSVWMSDASEMLKERFLSFSNRFPVFKETIDSYAQFLVLTAETYQNVEASIHSNASALG